MSSVHYEKIDWTMYHYFSTINLCIQIVLIEQLKEK